MQTILAYEKDVLLQPLFLKSFKPQKTLSDSLQKNSIFCGSGDSFASALLAEAYSNYKIQAADPLDLLKNKKIIKSKNVYIISISGKTISNIKIAKNAKKAIAITSNSNSRLVKACKNSILLKFPNSDVVTAGSISFLESALTCISLATTIKIPPSEKIFQHAAIEAKKIKFKNKIFILGNLQTYPIAMYAAAKFYEILGLNAYYERIEQFSHMELFSTKPGDTVMIFEEKNSHNRQLVQNLKKVGINAVHPTITGDKITQFLFFTFLSQLVPLFEAKKKKQKECYFVTAKNLRNVSDDMIY